VICIKDTETKDCNGHYVKTGGGSNMWKKIGQYALPILICLILILTLIPGCAQEVTKDKIIIGAARPISGPLNQIGDYAFGPVMQIWADEVNAAGGLKVGGKKLPIELKIYDDTSDLGTSTRLVEKLILEDKVDFLFPNCSTAR
jgi:branched-chain amino acid transport system substrate-binding protein